VVIVGKDILKNIPFLQIVKKDLEKESLPLIIFVHGFTSGKEHNLHFAYLLAEKGFRVILPEAEYHGEREQSLTEKEIYLRFWEIVIKTIHELNLFKEYYVQEELADPNRIGLAGTSMGGIVTLGALTQYSWIKTAVSLMGMPAYESFSLWQMDQLQTQGFEIPFSEKEIEEQLAMLRQYDLSIQPEKLNGTPLLFWHGKKDQTVPYKLAYQFYQSYKDTYSSETQNIHFITDKQADHKVSREGLKATVNWFETNL
jgi:uncharacterized protein